MNKNILGAIPYKSCTMYGGTTCRIGRRLSPPARRLELSGFGRRTISDTLQKLHYVRRGIIVTSMVDPIARGGRPAKRRVPANGERARLRAAGLTNRQATCLSLYYFDNLSLGQIATELSIHRTVVSQHMRYGRRKLSTAGLEPRRMPWPAQPVLILMDIEGLDEFAPESLAAHW